MWFFGYKEEPINFGFKKFPQLIWICCNLKSTVLKVLRTVINCFPSLNRHTGKPRRTVFEWQPQPSQPPFWAGSLQQAVNHEYWELSTQSPPPSNCCWRAFVHYSVFKDAGSISCHGLIQTAGRWSHTLFKHRLPLMFHIYICICGYWSMADL